MRAAPERRCAIGLARTFLTRGAGRQLLFFQCLRIAGEGANAVCIWVAVTGGATTETLKGDGAGVAPARGDALIKRRAAGANSACKEMARPMKKCARRSDPPSACRR